MDGSIPTSISAQDLYGSIGTAVAPVVVDVRRDAAFVADDRMIAGAIRRNPEEVEDWRRDLPSGRVVVVCCGIGSEGHRDRCTLSRARDCRLGRAPVTDAQ